MPLKEPRKNELTSQERANPETDTKTRLLCGLVVFQAKLNIQAIRENNGLLLFDPLIIIKFPHQLDERFWIARVLAYTSKYFCIRFFMVIGAGEAAKELFGAESIG